jgi:peptidoglycan/xylan/chitin deacetylase (PgdA/CDA1 family)
VRRLRERLGLVTQQPPARAVVLMYHRIATPGSAGHGLGVSPAHFAEHLETLSSAFQPVRLADIVASISGADLPARAVSVTFDDGYLDNLLEAKPLLERAEVPATVFVVSGYVEGRSRFWWDELEEICVAADLPDVLELEIDGRVQQWKVNPDQTRHLFRELRRALGPLEGAERDASLDRLQRWSGVEPSRSRQTLSAAELRRLAEGGLVEIGAHTVTHPPLTRVKPVRQVEEIRSSRIRLSELVEHDVRLFSYPFGAEDVTAARSARAAGVSCACTSVGAAVTETTNPYQLPRVYVDDWSGDELIRRVASVSGWTD